MSRAKNQQSPTSHARAVGLGRHFGGVVCGRGRRPTWCRKMACARRKRRGMCEDAESGGAIPVFSYCSYIRSMISQTAPLVVSRNPSLSCSGPMFGCVKLRPCRIVDIVCVWYYSTRSVCLLLLSGRTSSQTLDLYQPQSQYARAPPSMSPTSTLHTIGTTETHATLPNACVVVSDQPRSRVDARVNGLVHKRGQCHVV